MAACEQVPVPAQDRSGLDEQLESAEQVAGEPVQQRGQEGPVCGREPRPVRAELSLQDADLVAQHQDFRVLVLIACRQHRQGSQGRTWHPVRGCTSAALTCMDEIIGKNKVSPTCRFWHGTGHPRSKSQ
jgi:hypothetical protein